MEWSFELATEKLKRMLDLDDSKSGYARLAVQAAVNEESDDKLESWHFDFALRHCGCNEKSGVEDDALMQGLLIFYLEIEGIDSDVATAAVTGTSGTSLQRLDALVIQRTISWKVSRRVYFLFIIETCEPAIRNLMQQHHHDLGDAIRGGLASLAISRSQAQVAEFCLLTGLNPIEARGYSADEDLPRAVSDALETRVSEMDHTILVLQARLFPMKSSGEVIQEALLKDSGPGTEMNYLRSGQEYLISLFHQETMCISKERTRIYLEESAWSMENAVGKYRANALAQCASASTDIFNPARSTPDDSDPDLTLEALVINYETSHPTQTPSDYGVKDLIRRFKSNHLSNSALHSLHQELTYRHRSCLLAMHIAQKLDLWKAVAAVPIWEWDPHQQFRRDEGFLENVGLLQRNTGWFRPVRKGEGMPYAKPLWYLARALEMQGIRGKERVLKWIERAEGVLRGELEGGIEEVER